MSAAALVAAVSFGVAFAGSVVLALGVGIVVLAALAWMGWRRATARETDLSRRSFLAGAGAAGLGVVAAGSGIGRVAERLARPNPAPTIERMARRVGAESMELVRRGHFPGRSGELQLVLAPFNTSNYSFESLKLEPKDPRSSHALSWGYTERVPIVVHAPGLVERTDRTERVTLADLAPSAAQLMGFDFATRDGSPLPGLPTPQTPPKVVVTFVIDGGGWNVLSHWPTAWPNLRSLMGKGIVYRNAIMGSFPSVTACAHATIGTGAFPSGHGISGHSVRRNGHIVKAWGQPGHADPTFLLLPTLADAWSEHSGQKAWIGEIGYQIWHLGMIGHGGGRPLGRTPVAVFYDEDHTKDWRSQNESLYRLPDGSPSRDRLSSYLRTYFGPERGAQLDRAAGRKVCCSPPIIRYMGDVIAAAMDNEGVGTHGATDLLYINFKMPDYTGHVYNMLSIQEKIALQAVDRELGLLVATLEQRFAPGEFALLVTADHGQCPLVDIAGGVRLDPLQLADDINHAFGRSVWPLVEDVRPSEVYIDHRALWDGGVTLDDIAGFLSSYRYGNNVGPYVPKDLVAQARLDHPEFAGVFSSDYISKLDRSTVAGFGSGSFASADPGLPPVTW
jgi:hypothetical protein